MVTVGKVKHEMKKGCLKGEVKGRLGLTWDTMRLLVINDRVGVYDK